MTRGLFVYSIISLSLIAVTVGGLLLLVQAVVQISGNYGPTGSRKKRFPKEAVKYFLALRRCE